MLFSRICSHAPPRLPTALLRPFRPLSTRPPLCTSAAPSLVRSQLAARAILRPRPNAPQFFSRSYASEPHWRAKPHPSTNLPEATVGQPRLLDRLKAAGHVSGAEQPPEMSILERLWRPFLFTVLTSGAAIYYGYTWQSPMPSERWFPTVPQSFATVAGIIAVNAAVFVAWRIPLPITWRFLNRFAISVPAYPYSLSMLGSVFSHQQLLHLGMNMFALYIFGTSLCEQIGPGWFMSLYVTGGVVSSFTSLAYNVLLHRLYTSSLGASGAVCALVGAYAYFNPDNHLYLIFLPFLAIKAKYFVGGLAALDLAGLIRGKTKFDHVAHLAGTAWGVTYAYYLQKEAQRRVEAKRREMLMRGFR